MKTTGHIISHTHWDREWRVPEWNSRWRLQIMMNRLLQKLEENPDFIFLFDGQVVSIHDYLEICPDKRDKIEKFIKNGQLQIGPWYNLPDLYPVCGEALVRNLQTGIREANQLGNCLNIAYTTFGWGQTAQFPQLFRGFGIDRVVVGKNVSKKRAPHSEFLWSAPDGSEVFATRLGVEKRANFFFAAVMPATYGTKYSDDRTQVRWGEGGWMFHRADSYIDSETTFIPDDTYHPEVVEDAVKDAWETCKESLVQEHLFMGNGCDSTAPSDVVDKIVEKINAESPDKRLIYSDLNTYLSLVQKQIEDNSIELSRVMGELRDGPVHALSANALATRMPLKILNRKAQDQLIRYAEPFAVLAGLKGSDYPKEFLRKAWNFLLLAHSHDAINGVTLDKTAEDTAYKLKQVIEIGQVVTDMAAAEILKRVDLSGFDQEDILLAVFNPTPHENTKVIKAVIDIPENKRCRRLKAYDPSGEELTVQNQGHAWHAAPVCVQNSRALPYYSYRHTVHLETGSIPAYGYKIIKIVPDEFYSDKLMFWHGTYEQGTQVTGPLTMENEFLKVQLHSDGTYDLFSKITGAEFDGLGYYEDSGDVGDYWQRVKPSYDQVVVSKGQQADIYLKEDGPLVTTYVCKLVMNVPASAEYHSKFDSKRTEGRGEIEITTELTLKADSKYLEIKTTVDNRVKDHRLRVALPTGIEAQLSDAMGHFHVDSRPIEREYKDGIRDGEMSTLPMQNFVDLHDGQNGLAVLNKELTEFEVSEDKSRIIYLTLLRSMEVNICTEGRCATVETGAEGSQCLGKHEYHYALFPHKGNWSEGEVYPAMETYNYLPCAYQISKHDNGNQSVEKSLLQIDSTVIQLSAVKPSEKEDGVIVRIFNPAGEKVDTTIKMAEAPREVWRVNLKEEMEEQIPLNSKGDIPLELGGGKIISLLCKM